MGLYMKQLKDKLIKSPVASIHIAGPEREWVGEWATEQASEQTYVISIAAS